MLVSEPFRRWGSALLAASALLLAPPAAHATFRYGDVQLSGNVEEQTLIRTPEIDSYNLVQERNTFRLQYEHQLAQGGSLLHRWNLPGISSINAFGYYRFVYDSVYNIAPGGILQASDGSRGGKFEDFSGSDRKEIAFENVIREAFVDVKLSVAPVSFRIGRQQMNWGEADSFRALDSANPIDLTWHLQQEAGLLGKVGFDELRIPLWAVKALIDLGQVGPLSNAFLEIYDVPFDFQQSKLRFLPAPWSVSVRNPFRQGLVLDAGAQTGLPPGALLVQPCFDFTGATQSNGALPVVGGENIDFSTAATNGQCNSKGLPQTTLRHGLFDRHDPTDVNQVGTRFSASTDFGATFSLDYMHRRHYIDIPTAGSAKFRQGILLSNPTAFLYVNPLQGTVHQTTDPITRQTTTVLGYLRVPVEFYMPYVDVFGGSANYADDYTGTVFRAEATLTHGFPISSATDPNGVVKKDVMLSMLGFDRPTWIQFLNPRATWLITGQLFINWIPSHEDSMVGVPNSALIPGQFRDQATTDRVKEVEMVSTLIATTFYRGGSIVPVFAIIPQWSYMPTFEFIAGGQIYLTNNLIFTPELRIFTTPHGGVVDEPYGVGRLGKWDEVQLKLTYQF
jgi:uncharacterized protein DUF1302